MIQLAFEPAFDPFHGAFRILRELTFRGHRPISIPRLKILDVYVAEPRRCLDIRVPPKLRAGAKLAAACQYPTYGKRPSASSLFNRMSPMQDAAIQTLVQQSLLDADAFGQGQAVRTSDPLSADLNERILASNEADLPLMSFLFSELDQVSFDGAMGLKARTGLGEYRYDIV